MRESEIVAKIRNLLKRGGIWHYKTIGSSFQRAGIPDLIACRDGRFVAIEVKVPGAKPTPKQQREMAEIRRSGGIAFTATSVHDVFEQLELGSEILPLFHRKRS
jgi:Holliday junction resolvase